MICGIDHIQLAMPGGGEKRARKFYRDVLGLEEIDKPEGLQDRGGVWFRANGFDLHLGIEDPFMASVKAHPGFLVEDIDSAAKVLETAGVYVAWDSSIRETRRFYAHDPFGNRLEFLHRAL